MKTTMVGRAGQVAVVAGLTLALGLGSVGGQRDTGDNHFVRHPGPAAGQTGIDRYDPYAPVDLSAFSGTTGAVAGYAAVTAKIGSQWDVPPSPERPGKPS